MIERLLKDWIVFVLLALVVWFVVYCALQSRKEEKKDREQNKPQEKK